jgi:tape measure domain-containing protein
MTGINIPIGGDMAPFLAIAAELRGEMKKLSGSVRSSLRPMRGESATIAGAMKRIWQKSFRGIVNFARDAASAIRGAFSRVTSFIPGGGLLGPLAGIVGIAASLALVTTQLKGAFSAAAAFEDLEVSVSSFLGSTKAAADLLGELQEFADKTPFATRDIQEAAGALLGAGVRGNVAGITKDIAAVAKNGQQLKELADALGKGFAKGKFQTEELNKFLERGINLLPALEQQTGKAGAELTKAIEAGLGFEDVSAAIASMSREGGMFFGLLERRSQTFTGLASTLSSVWETVRRTFAQPILDALKPVLQDAIGLVGTFKEAAEKAGKAIGGVILSTFALIKGGRLREVFSAGLTLAITGAIDLLMRGMKAAAATLAAGLAAVFIKLQDFFTDPFMLAGMSKLFEGLGDIIAGKIKQATSFTEKGRYEGEMLEMVGKHSVGTAGLHMGTALERQQSIGDFLANMLTEMGTAGKEAFGETGEAVKEAAANYKELMETVTAETEALRRRAAVSGPSEGATGDANSGPLTGLGDFVGKAVGQAMTLTTSLGRVGGGGFGATFLPMVSEAKKGNQLLARIERNTANMGGLTAAIV